MTTQYQFGFYKVGAEIFTHKSSALIRATQTGVTPTWHFHSEIYSKLNWQQDLPISLDHIYQKRAQQLRDKYEYLVLSFSGGSDSWTALKAFVDSNTYLDEIFVRWPIEATYKKYNMGTSNDTRNTVSEWELTILPMIKKYKELLPNTKFTIQDWSNSILTAELTDKDWLNVQDYLNPGIHFRFNAIGEGELDAMHAGKNTAIIFGSDKPQIWQDNGKVYCYFLDKLSHVHPHNSFSRNSELFYWTPDLPELVLIQARNIFRHLEKNKDALKLIDRHTPFTPERKFIWDSVVRHVIYNDYTKLNAFQAKKPESSIYDAQDTFFWDMTLSNPKYLQSWEYGLKNVLQSINDRYIQKSADGNPTGFTGFIDGMYYLGSITTEVDH